MEINLLPKGYRQKAKIFSYLDIAIPYLLMGLVSVLVINLLIGLIITKVAFTKGRVESVWQNKKPQYKDIAALREDLNKLKAQTRNLQEITSAKVPFSQTLYLLYSKLPSNIWFRELIYQKQTLQLRGIALDFKEAASISLKKYLDTLKSTNITNQFPQIKIDSQEMRRVNTRQVVYFNLIFKEEE